MKDIVYLTFNDNNKSVMDQLKENLTIRDVKSYGLEHYTTYNGKEYQIIDWGYEKGINGNFTGKIFATLVREVK